MFVPVRVLKRRLGAAFLGHGVRERTKAYAQIRFRDRWIRRGDRRGLRWGGRRIRLDGGRSLRTRRQIPRHDEKQKRKINEDVP